MTTSFDARHLPVGPTNLAHWIEGHPKEAVAVTMVDSGTGQVGDQMTWAELRARSAALRGSLAERGVGPGDRVALLSANTPQFVVAYMAVAGMGAMTVPISPMSPETELWRQLTLIEPKAAVVGPGGRLESAAAARLALVVEAGGAIEVGAGGPPVFEWSTAMAGTPAPVKDVDPATPAVAIFTAGTSNSPRAAVLSHGNLLATVSQILGATERYLSSADVVLDVLPWAHLFGLNAVLGTTLAVGAETVVLHHPRGKAVIEVGRARGATVITAVPPVVSDMTAAARAAGHGDDGQGGWPELRWVLSGASDLPASATTAFNAAFGIDVHQGYGLTEAGPGVTTSIGHEARPGSVGLVLPGVNVRLVDADGTETARGDRGEVWVRGPNVFSGYWKDPSGTETMLRDGWLRTGDLAVIDDEGYMRIVDRRRDVIIVNGFNVHPGEVESVLLCHPDVTDAVVVSEPDEHTGEAVTALVVPREGIEVTPETLTPVFAGKLARYKWPTRVRLVRSVPRGLGGKLLRRAFRHGI